MGLHTPPSKREIDVLHLIASEYTTKEIANMLFISRSTVETHRRRLLEKTGARNTAGLILKSIKHGYISINLSLVAAS